MHERGKNKKVSAIEVTVKEKVMRNEVREYHRN